jgi:hypothetical protein
MHFKAIYVSCGGIVVLDTGVSKAVCIASKCFWFRYVLFFGSIFMKNSMYALRCGFYPLEVDSFQTLGLQKRSVLRANLV